MTDTPNLLLPLMDLTTGDKEGIYSSAMKFLDFLVQPTVISTLSTPPGSPAEGARYLVGSSPTGAFAGHTNHIAFYLGGWVFRTPVEGWKIYDQGANTSKIFDGATWFTDTGGGAGTPPTSSDDFKDPSANVRVTSVTLSAPGATLDGVTMVAGDSFFLDNGAATAGLYDWNGAATPATRRADADTSAEVTSGMIVTVAQGTSAGTLWQLTTPDPITLDTTALTFTQVSAATSTSFTNQVIQYSAFSSNNLNLATSHRNKVLLINNGTNNVTITVNSGVMANNAEVKIIRLGTGKVTVIDGSASINTSSSGRALKRYGGIHLKRRTSTVWETQYIEAYPSITAVKTANYTATALDDVIPCDASGGAFTVTLPTAASSTGKILTIKKVDASLLLVTIDGDGSETIDGETTIALNFKYESLTIQSDGTNWHVLHANRAVRHQFAISDETTALTTGTAKLTFNIPGKMRVVAIRGAINTVSSSGIPTVDINEAGVSILTDKLTIDANEKSSLNAATAATFSDTILADDSEITADIDVAGTGAKGFKVTLIGWWI
jgi:hypothetical protein